MTRRRITLTLEIDEDGGVTLVESGAGEAALAETSAKKDIILAPVDPVKDWIGGYDPDFLAQRVNLPRVIDASSIAPLKHAYGQTFTAAQKKAGVLHYKGYSVVMNKARRLAFFSAANLDGAMRPAISGRQDDWNFDDRIDRKHQIGNSYYKGTKTVPNRFDRGHLTRRDDMEWGTDPHDAVNRANGTCTWTNCSPQHEVFNQGKDKGLLLWQALERYILEQTAAHRQFRCQVITGPVLAPTDPLFRGIAYPLAFWKVVAALRADGALFATAYLLSQKETIDKHPLEAAFAEPPFGPFGTYQRRIAEIAVLTGLDFTWGDGRPLTETDPLESAAAAAFADRGALQGLDDIVLG